jgi:hypothetical protein
MSPSDEDREEKEEASRRRDAAIILADNELAWIRQYTQLLEAMKMPTKPRPTDHKLQTVHTASGLEKLQRTQDIAEKKADTTRKLLISLLGRLQRECGDCQEGNHLLGSYGDKFKLSKNAAKVELKRQNQETIAKVAAKRLRTAEPS